ncbi:MAG: hypothetical protein A2017_22010 [Lentisphaerae bacterium GWF2_44_16]|nr:MAG: hypothetical protein A2017_22010 [Lentisphaerae bacterium GWF2_44_16]
MKLQSIVVVVLRLMALSLVFKLIIVLVPVIVWFPQMFHGNFKLFFFNMWTSLLVFLVFVGCIVVMWMFAYPLARLITRQTSVDLAPINLDLPDCYTIALVVLGLLGIMDNLSDVIDIVYYVIVAIMEYGLYWKGQIDINKVLRALGPFIFGVILLVKSRTWALALAKRQGKDEGTD